MPESKAFVPTMVTDMQEANPLKGIPMIAAPTPNNKGTAELTYPIELPKGRNGLQPNVDLHYSSANAGSNGILGPGWSINFPAITIDTRWGVPRYDLRYETEQYLVNGAPILLRDKYGTIDLPQQTNTFVRRKEGDVLFYARDIKNADRIVRHGINPTDYWWEVTDRNGITTYYGRKFDPEKPNNDSIDENSVVRTGNKSIAYWAATATVDVYGNYIQYINHETRSGKNYIHVEEIKYTGNYKQHIKPAYIVSMSYDTDRIEPVSSCRLGVFQEERSKLGSLRIMVDPRPLDMALKQRLIQNYKLE